MRLFAFVKGRDGVAIDQDVSISIALFEDLVESLWVTFLKVGILGRFEVAVEDVKGVGVDLGLRLVDQLMNASGRFNTGLKPWRSGPPGFFERGRRTGMSGLVECKRPTFVENFGQAFPLMQGKVFNHASYRSAELRGPFRIVGYLFVEFLGYGPGATSRPFDRGRRAPPYHLGRCGHQ